MKEIINTPNGLAKWVVKRLDGAKTPYKIPSEEVIIKLFQTLFYTSLKTEEGQFINLTVTLIDPENPDPTPPERIEPNRWSYIFFEAEMELSIKNLVKLSKAVDPWSSSLAVYYDKDNNLFIWGMIDQKIHHQRYLNYETEEKPDQPGLFETSIVGIGDINVIFDFQLIANLNQNNLIKGYIDVFKSGPIKDQLKENAVIKEKTFLDSLKNEFPEIKTDEWKNEISSMMNESICRILLKIQSYRHGGAILITSNIKSDLDIKYKINYDRLSNSIDSYLMHFADYDFSSDKIHNDIFEKKVESIPTDLYLVENVSEFEMRETEEEIKGSIRFISSLSCVDGLVVLNNELNVLGFGAVIKTEPYPETIFKSKTSKLNEENLIKINSNHFGTRHRSMFSYCWNNDNSIGFVVSQDGDIRAIMKVNDKLIIWENIKILQYNRSNKLKRLFEIKKRLI